MGAGLAEPVPLDMRYDSAMSEPWDQHQAEPRGLEEPVAGPAEALFHTAYSELRKLAAGAARRAGANHTLQPTALVNEAWLKLRNRLGDFRSHDHFLAVASLAMRQILSDHARAARAGKRACGKRVSVYEAPDEGADPAEVQLDLVALDESLTKLADLNERHARVVELRFLASLSIEQTARILGVSHWTVEKDWAMARAWLRKELDEAG